MNSILKLSEELLYNVKLNLPYENEVHQLSKLKYKNIIVKLATDNHKKAFWINIYNSFYQILAKQYKEGEIIDENIYKTKSIIIASKRFSLDSIEHGILRKRKFVIGFGYLYNPFYPKFIEKLSVRVLDYRIHFALNCGAISCPPILVYDYDKIENQLELATHSFIESETILIENDKKIKTSRLFLWYLGDFGNFKKVKQIIGKVFHKNLSKFKISFQKYNWTKQLHNFK